MPPRIFGLEPPLRDVFTKLTPTTLYRQGGSSPKIQGGIAHPPPQFLHHRVHVVRFPKPKKYELYICLHLKCIIMVANSVTG